MPNPIVGLHHVTAIASDAQRTLDFYTAVLGLRFVKRTVNFDDPGSFHFYFGDDAGSPGTILTFFVWPGASRGHAGVGETSAAAFSISASSLEYWENRLLDAGVPVERTDDRFGESVLSFGDPDGMRVELIATARAIETHPSRTSHVPQNHAIRGFHGVTLCEAGYELTAKIFEVMGFRKTETDGNRIRFAGSESAPGHCVDILVQPQLVYGHMGAGTIHHIAFRVPDDQLQLEWRGVLCKAGLNATPVLDRVYFHSIYFREPGGVLFELATDPPGFALDEPVEHLGEALKLPPWLEKHRAEIEKALPAIEMPDVHVEQRHG